MSETLLDAIGEAFDAEEARLEEPNDGEPTTEVEVQADESESGLDTSAATETEGGGDTTGADDSERGDDVHEESVRSGEETGEQREVGAVEDTPPVSLGAAAREAWKDTPKAMRDEMAKREADYNRGIQKYAEDAKRVHAMDRTLAPYQQLFAMNGGPQEFMPSLLQTASVLQMGTPQQKAFITANLIEQFGVNPAELDSVLTARLTGGGQQMPQGQPQPQPQQYSPQQVEQLVDQRFQQREQGELQTQAQTDLHVFSSDPKNEFYHDVKMEMADILEMSANRGVELSLKEAYDKACQLNPQVSGVLASRANTTSAADKRRASSSVSGSRGGDGTTDAPTTMRGAIEDAWAGLEQM